MSQCSDSIEDFKRVSLILDDEEVDEFGLTGMNLSGRQSGEMFGTKPCTLTIGCNFKMCSLEPCPIFLSYDGCHGEVVSLIREIDPIE